MINEKLLYKLPAKNYPQQIFDSLVKAEIDDLKKELKDEWFTPFPPDDAKINILTPAITDYITDENEYGVSLYVRMEPTSIDGILKIIVIYALPSDREEVHKFVSHVETVVHGCKIQEMFNGHRINEYIEIEGKSDELNYSND